MPRQSLTSFLLGDFGHFKSDIVILARLGDEFTLLDAKMDRTTGGDWARCPGSPLL
jgi:hypothetical protein